MYLRKYFSDYLLKMDIKISIILLFLLILLIYNSLVVTPNEARMLKEN